MADPRYYAKLDVGYFDNPKTTELLEERPRVLVLHLRAITYCRQHLTDGTFPLRLVVRLACASYCGSQCGSQCDRICDVCMAVQSGLFINVNGKTAEVHDYLKHQDSVEAIEARKMAGKKGAAARWGDADSNADRNADRNADANAKERRGEERSSTRANGTRKKNATTIPEDWKPTTQHAQQAEEKGVDLSSEAFRFRNHAISVDRRLVNWNAGFTNWLANAKPDQRTAPTRGQQPEGW